MEKIAFDEMECMVSYNDYTGFVYDDGTQVMYSGGTISEDVMNTFRVADVILICNMGNLPAIKKILQDNLLAEFEPAEGVVDDGYNKMVAAFTNDEGWIVKVEDGSKTTYMLIFDVCV